MKFKVVCRKLYDYARTDLKDAAIKKQNELKEIKVKVVWRKVRDYVRYDLKEIAFPSCLPDPPGYVPKKKKPIFFALPLKQQYLIVKEAARLYAVSWVRDIGPELYPRKYKNIKDGDDELGGAGDKGKEKDATTLEDLAVAARGGMETLRPALQRLYMTKASAYKDALKSFIEGYQEGVQKVRSQKDDFESQKHQDTNDSKKSI